MYVRNEHGKTAAEVAEDDETMQVFATAEATMELHKLATDGRLPILRRLLQRPGVDPHLVRRCRLTSG